METQGNERNTMIKLDDLIKSQLCCEGWMKLRQAQ